MDGNRGELDANSNSPRTPDGAPNPRGLRGENRPQPMAVLATPISSWLAATDFWNASFSEGDRSNS